MQELNWDDLLSRIKTKSVAFYAILSKCEHEINGEYIRIYTKFPFYKKKLETNRFLTLIREELSSINQANPAITVKIESGQPPIVDETISEVAKIMGGGEVVENA